MSDTNTTLPAEKRCVDCKYFRADEKGVYFHKCEKTGFVTSPVDGSRVRAHGGWIYCDTNRNMDWFAAWAFNACGKRGRYFEAKQS